MLVGARSDPKYSCIGICRTRVPRFSMVTMSVNPVAFWHLVRRISSTGSGVSSVPSLIIAVIRNIPSSPSWECTTSGARPYTSRVNNDSNRRSPRKKPSAPCPVMRPSPLLSVTDGAWMQLTRWLMAGWRTGRGTGNGRIGEAAVTVMTAPLLGSFGGAAVRHPSRNTGEERYL